MLWSCSNMAHSSNSLHFSLSRRLTHHVKLWPFIKKTFSSIFIYLVFYRAKTFMFFLWLWRLTRWPHACQTDILTISCSPTPVLMLILFTVLVRQNPHTIFMEETVEPFLAFSSLSHFSLLLWSEFWRNRYLTETKTNTSCLRNRCDIFPLNKLCFMSIIALSILIHLFRWNWCW